MDSHLFVATWNDTRKDGRTLPGYIMTDESICADNLDGEARAMACSGLSRQLWYHNIRTSAIVHASTGLCLSVSRPPELRDGVSVHACDGSSEQQWTFESVPWN